MENVTASYRKWKTPTPGYKFNDYYPHVFIIIRKQMLKDDNGDD